MLLQRPPLPFAPVALALLAASALGLGATACVAPPAPGSANGLSIPPPPPDAPTLEFREVLRADDWRSDRAPRYTYEDVELELGPPHHYGLEEIDVIDGHLGTRALEITLAPAHGPPMTHWTSSLVGEKVALLADGEVVLLMKIEEPLPNPFQLHAHYDDAEARALAGRLEARSAPQRDAPRRHPRGVDDE